VFAALHDVDASFAHLMTGLEERGLAENVNVVVVSDHGMANLSPDRVIFLDDYVDAHLITLLDVGSVAPVMVARKDGKSPAFVWRILFKEANTNREQTTILIAIDCNIFLYALDLATVHAQLVAAARHGPLSGHFNVYTHATMPPDFNYNGSDRIAPLIVVAETRWFITTRDKYQLEDVVGRGTHGYPASDDEEDTMHAVFYGWGPSFRDAAAGKSIPPFPNIELYNFLCALLHLQPAPNDGTFLRSDWDVIIDS
jgi:hypothetical protein